MTKYTADKHALPYPEGKDKVAVHSDVESLAVKAGIAVTVEGARAESAATGKATVLAAAAESNATAKAAGLVEGVGLRVGAVEASTSNQGARLAEAEAVMEELTVSNVALDVDGVPYYSPGSNTVKVFRKEDGTLVYQSVPGSTPLGLQDSIVQELLSNQSTESGRALGAVIAETSGVNPKTYKHLDAGITDDTASMLAAYARAGSLNLPVSIPPGDYRVTGNIPGFWAVPTIGAGRIVCGQDVWHAKSGISETNTIWVSAAGNDGNNGISRDYPIRTLGRLWSILRGLGSKAEDGPWVARILGTIPGGQTFTSLPRFRFPLTFEGDTNAFGQPATIIEKVSGGSDYGLRFDPSVFNNITVKNIHFKGFANGFNGYGLLMKGGGNLDVKNCWAEGCDIGFAAIRNVDFSFDNCRSWNNKGGFWAQYSSSGAFLYCTAENNTNAGFFVTRNAVAHADYCHANGNGIGLYVDHNARVTSVDSHYRRNDYGVRAEGGAEWARGTGDRFYENSPDANRIPFGVFGSARETRMYSMYSNVEFRTDAVFPAVSHGGTTARTLLVNGFGANSRSPSIWFGDPQKKMRFVVRGSVSGPGTKRLSLWATHTDATLTEQFGSVATDGAGNFVMELHIFPDNSLKAQRVFATINTDGSTISTRLQTTAAVDMTKERMFRLFGELADPAARITIENIETYFTG